MITPIDEQDFPALLVIVEAAVRECITSSEDEAQFLVGEITASLEKWSSTKVDSFHAKYREPGKIVGFIIVKEFWNLSHLFVLPSFQRRGIGRALIRNAIGECRSKSPRQKIQLNSSEYAQGFYAAVGFTQSGPAIDKPGGCVPFEYGF